MRNMKIILPLFLLVAVLFAAGCGGGGAANNFISSAPGNIEGFVYEANYNAAAAGRAPSQAAREAGAAPAGYVPVNVATVRVVGTSNFWTTTDANGHFMIAGIAPGTYTLAVNKEGMSELALTVIVAAGQTTNVNNTQSNDALKLAPAAHGTLLVTSTAGSGATVVPVTGAKVLINNVDTGKVTPATFNDLALLTATGTPYNVNVQAAGYTTSLPKTVSLTSGTPNTAVNFTLVPADGNNAPYTTITLPRNDQVYNLGDMVTCSGAAIDVEDGNLTGTSLVWIEDNAVRLGSGPAFATSTLAAGVHYIALLAADSAGKTTSASVRITINDTPSAPTVNAAPTAAITTPIANAPYTTAQTVTFTGGANDPEDGVLTGASLAWTSSIDGALGMGNLVQRTLSAGKHVITLTATDSGGLKGAANVSITVTQTATVNQLPTARIVTPVDGATATTNTAIAFTGAAVDTEDGNLPAAALVWTSDLDGVLGTGNYFAHTLTAGTHHITLTATDSQGGVDTDTATVIVSVSTAPNTAPTAFIATPIDGASGTANTTFTFTGTGVDREDGNLTGASLVWTSSLMGRIGTGNTFSRKLSGGTHVITLTATDAQGLTGAKSITVIVSGTNAAPTATILTPLAGTANLTTTMTLTFSGAGIDTEDGNLTGASLVWTSNLIGQIGTGNFFQRTLTAGTHVITLTVTDSNGVSGTATRTLTVR